MTVQTLGLDALRTPETIEARMRFTDALDTTISNNRACDQYIEAVDIRMLPEYYADRSDTWAALLDSSERFKAVKFISTVMGELTSRRRLGSDDAVLGAKILELHVAQPNRTIAVRSLRLF